MIRVTVEIEKENPRIGRSNPRVRIKFPWGPILSCRLDSLEGQGAQNPYNKQLYGFSGADAKNVRIRYKDGENKFSYTLTCSLDKWT